MNKKTIEAIQARIDDDSDYQEDLVSYQKMVELQWELPETWAAKTFIRKQVSTDSFDVIKMAGNIYDASAPKWEVLPNGQAEKEKADMLETALEWWMKRANKLGSHEPLRKALHNSCLQNRVIYQMDYLPYWLPKDKNQWTEEQKEALRQSSFCVTNHDARNVYYEMGKYGLKWVAAVTIVSAEDIKDHWSVYADDSSGKKIKSALSKIDKYVEENEEQMFILVDYISLKKREVSAFLTSSETISDFENYSESSDRVDILDEKNELGFIPWVVVEGEGQPMLYSSHKSGAWENQNLYNTLIDSTVMRRAVFPILKHVSPTGEPLDIDFTGEEPVVEMRGGEQAEVFQPSPIDPALSQLANTNIARLAQTTGMKGLSSIEVAGNVQYAAVQAVIQLHMTSLQPYVRTVEKANAQLGDLCFKWIDKTNSSEPYWREKKKGEGMKDRGMGGVVTKDKFDPDLLFIECHLIAKAPTDKQQLFNMYAQLKQAGAHVSWKHIIDDKLDIGNGDVLEADWLDEEAGNIAIQQKAKELDAELSEKMKQKDFERTMAAQQQAQQQAQPQGVQGEAPPEQGNPMMPGGQGFNAAAGGQPTAPAVPGATSPVQQ